MAFKIVQTPRFRRVVKVRTPAGEGHDEQNLEVVYNLIDDSITQHFDGATLEGQKDFLRAIIHHFPDVVDENGKPLEWSEALREDMLGWAHIRLAIMRGYNAAVLEERLGN